MPRVTVIIPTFNYSSVLPYCIGSVLRQKFTDFELLVIGDHCTDDSAEVVGSFSDPRVRWINLPANTGHQSGPNNEGIRQGRGDLIAYLGHDDLWLANHLEQAVQRIDAGADLTYAVTEMIPPGDRQRVFAPKELSPYIPRMWMPPTSVVHRRKVALAAGGWKHFRDEVQDPEAMLWERIYRAGHKIEFIPRLTAVKFTAEWRKDVYKTKPFHEQAAWTQRILEEPDFVETELVQMFVPYRHQAWQAKPLEVVVREFCQDLYERLRWRLVRVGLMRPERRKRTRGEKFDVKRKFKGLPPSP